MLKTLQQIPLRHLFSFGESHIFARWNLHVSSGSAWLRGVFSGEASRWSRRIGGTHQLPAEGRGTRAPRYDGRELLGFAMGEYDGMPKKWLFSLCHGKRQRRMGMGRFFWWCLISDMNHNHWFKLVQLMMGIPWSSILSGLRMGLSWWWLGISNKLWWYLWLFMTIFWYYCGINSQMDDWYCGIINQKWITDYGIWIKKGGFP